MDVESKEHNTLMSATADISSSSSSSSSSKKKNTTTTTNKKTKKKKKKQLCVWGSIGLILTLAIVFTILGLTVFKAKKPVTTVNSVSLEDLDVSFDIARLKLYLNVTLRTNLTIKNPNSVGFKYSTSSAIFKYRDQVVGQAPIPAGNIVAHATSPMNISLTLMADRLLSDPNLISDFRSGTLPFTTYVHLTGKIRILFNIKIKSTTTCDVDIDVANRTISRQSCHYKTKL